jgi:uracil-DNA glycosylase
MSGRRNFRCNIAATSVCRTSVSREWLPVCIGAGREAYPTKTVRYVPKVANQAGARTFVPETDDLRQLVRAAQNCQGCELYRAATQAVLGEGPVSARIVLVGEQPGDREDLAGRPFVGPAGALLDRALADAGIARMDVYVTNAVKHFKFEERGKRRIHKKPSSAEIAACKPWLEAELAIVRPRLIVCLGATAAHSVIGPHHRLLKERGRFFSYPTAEAVTATVHPSAILRSPDPARRQLDYQAFVKDLLAVRERLNRRTKGA